MNPFHWLIDTLIDNVHVGGHRLGHPQLAGRVQRHQHAQSFVTQIGDFLHRATEPVLRPIRNILPNLGGIDLSPLVLILLLVFRAPPALAAVRLSPMPAPPSWLRGRADGVQLAVKVTPRAAISAVQGVEIDARGHAWLAVRSDRASRGRQGQRGPDQAPGQTLAAAGARPAGGERGHRAP